MNRRRGIAALLCAFSLLAAGLPQGAAAAELDEVFVTTDSTLPAGDGSTAEAPLQDINQAFTKVRDGGTVTIVGGYTSQWTQRTAAKAVTVRGATPSAYWSVRYNLHLDGDLKLERLRLETPCTTADGREIRLGGHKLEVAADVDTMVNGNYGQRPTIYTDSASARAQVTLKGGNYEAVILTGQQGADVMIDGAVTDRVTGSAAIPGDVTLRGRLYLSYPLSGIRTLAIEGDITLPGMNDVKNLVMNYGMLRQTAPGDILLDGPFEANGGILNLEGNLTAAGKVTGSGTLWSAGYRGSITSLDAASDATFRYDREVGGWSVAEKTENGKKIWYAALAPTTFVCYLDGTGGSADAGGTSPASAVNSLAAAYALAQASPLGDAHIIVSGDTTVSAPATPPDKPVSFSSVDNAILSFETDFAVAGARVDGVRLCFAPEAGILVGSGYTYFGAGTEVEGAPEIICAYSGTGLEQLDLYGGVFGGITALTDPADAGSVTYDNGILTLDGCQVGAVRGFEQVGVESVGGGAPTVSGDIDTNWLILDNLDGTVRVDGDVRAQTLLQDTALAPVLSLRSGKTVRAGDVFLTMPLDLEVRADAGAITEGVYLTCSGTVEGTVRLSGSMAGYVLEADAAGKTFTLRAAAAVPLELVCRTAQDGTHCTFDVTLSGTNARGVLVTALYDGDRLAAWRTDELAQSGNYSTVVEKPVEKQLTAKAFLWEDFENMQPLAAAQ